MSGTVGYDDIRAGTVRQVAQLMAAAAITAPNPAASCSWPANRTSWKPSSPTTPPPADDLARVIASLTEPPAILMGCSNGGLLSLQCALKHPELVAALVLVCPIVSGLGFTGHFTSRGGRRPGGDLTTAEEIEYWSSTDPWFTAPPNTGARDRLRALLTANPNNLRPKEHLERAYETPALPRLGQITVPTLIIAGEHDIADVHAHCGVCDTNVGEIAGGLARLLV